MTEYTVHVDRLNPHLGRPIVEKGRTHTRYQSMTSRWVSAVDEGEAIQKARALVAGQQYRDRYSRSR